MSTLISLKDSKVPVVFGASYTDNSLIPAEFLANHERRS